MAQLYLDDVQRRNPDALPPSNIIELVGTWIFTAVSALGHGNLLFAIKAAVLTGEEFYHQSSMSY